MILQVFNITELVVMSCLTLDLIFAVFWRFVAYGFKMLFYAYLFFKFQDIIFGHSFSEENINTFLNIWNIHKYA